MDKHLGRSLMGICEIKKNYQDELDQIDVYDNSIEVHEKIINNISKIFFILGMSCALIVLIKFFI
jgi:hypothetical protein